MEEILASIKRVIAEDSGQPPAARPGRSRSSEVMPPAEDDVLELSEPLSEGESLVSDNVAAASRQSLAALSAARERGDMPSGDGALEAVVRDMLKPILKDWLDRNLPEIVEELVTREIARITGKNF